MGGDSPLVFLLYNMLGKTLDFFFHWQTLWSFTLLNHLHAVGTCRKQSLSEGTHLCYFIKQPALRCKQQE